MHLVILASGLGSRLAPLTNHIPKFLVNIGKETGLTEQIRYWKQYYPESITLVVHSAYEELVRSYYQLYFSKDEQLEVLAENGEDFVPTPLHIKTVDEALGSAHAIMNSCEHLDGVDNVMISWCDILPGEQINYDNLQTFTGDPTVFTNYDYPNRYGLVPSGHAFAPQPVTHGGGVVGLYFVPHFKLVPFTDGQDFVDVITKYSTTGTVGEQRLSSVVDWGDKPKLEHTRSTADKARSFNAVEFHGDLVKKYALNEQGRPLIKREIAWYDALTQLNSKVNRPKTWLADDSFVMSKVKHGVMIWEHWPMLDEIGRAEVLTQVLDQLDLLHACTVQATKEVVQRDVKVEAFDKLRARYDEIKEVVDSFGKVDRVNGYHIGDVDPIELITWTATELMKHYEDVDTYSIIHGDLQFSNSMISPASHEVTFIDPRGYFGKTELYGLPDYDKAKLLYALSGYDQFNYSHDFHLKRLGNGEIWFDLPRPDLRGCEQIIKERFDNVQTLWLAIIWQGLAQYIKNDPVKSVAAHYHGLSLMHKLRVG
jgi:hypothetical protein